MKALYSWRRFLWIEGIIVLLALGSNFLASHLSDFPLLPYCTPSPTVCTSEICPQSHIIFPPNILCANIMMFIFTGMLWLVWINLVGFIFFSIRNFINRKKDDKTFSSGVS
jgi:uncharacterized membrane protein YccF (DUF307 family)